MDDLLKKMVSDLDEGTAALMLSGTRAVSALLSGWTEEEVKAVETAGWCWLDIWHMNADYGEVFTDEDLQLLSDMAKERGQELSKSEISAIVCEKENKHLTIEEYVSGCIPVSETQFRKRLPDAPAYLYVMHRMYAAENVEIMGNPECSAYVSARTGISEEKVKKYFGNIF